MTFILLRFKMILQADALALPLKPNSVDMIMTSPPYWGLRDYGFEQIFGGDKDCEHKWGKRLPEHHPGQVEQTINKNAIGAGAGQTKGAGNYCHKCQAWKGQLGLEPTPEFYIEHLTDIFNEAKRVLKKEGTLWLNISDTYAGSGGAGGDYNKGGLREGQPKFKQGETRLQPKCLCMIPEHLAWSLIQNGWILRNKIIWYKPNPMPSSVTDRFSNTYEFVYMFSKSQHYYFDLDAVREPHKPDIGYRIKTKNHRIVHTQSGRKKELEKKDFVIMANNPAGKNPGDVFEIATQPFPEAHFAVFPEKLCEKPIKAGCPEGGIVLDPFCGAGTAMLVAKEMKRRFIGIDIKEEYCKMAEKRLAQGVLP